jgi:methylated-DNA-[protein]-cysteine S-methyltransferase
MKLTEFEKEVYAAVLKIPLGETRTYAWVARAVGRPGSARAVGNALNKNPLAPFVPCHRVIASDGTLGGYRGGLKKKIKLLRGEKQAAEALATRRHGDKATNVDRVYLVARSPGRLVDLKEDL